MAGDWIKMRTDLTTSPKVVRMSSALSADKLRIVGGLHAVWSLFDVHAVDGWLDGYTLAVLDETIGFPGLAGAMSDVGWLLDYGDSLEIPRFDEHNSKSAKRRATDTENKRERRKLSASDADKKPTREEKRRDISTPNGVDGTPPENRATRLPADWALPTDWATWALDERPDLNPAEVAARFADHWHAKAGKDGRKLDWLATWRNWVRNERMPAAGAAHQSFRERDSRAMAEQVAALAPGVANRSALAPTFNTEARHADAIAGH